MSELWSNLSNIFNYSVPLAWLVRHIYVTLAGAQVANYELFNLSTYVDQ